jgi:teichuronic acid biosynthesis glycosyltransferase TuaG
MIFSIIITTYNYEKYIRESVESALNQDFSGEYEVIVIDDCSTDGTSQILDSYNSLIRIHNKKNLSLEVSANKAIRKANGKYIVRLDADDYLEGNFLSEAFKHIENENIFYYGDYTNVSENGLHLSKINLIEFDRKEIKCRGDFLETGTIYSKKMLLGVGLYSEKIKNCGLENYQLILNLMGNGFVGKHIKKNLFFYRRHSDNLSSEKFESIVEYGCKLTKQYGLGFYSINQYHPYLNVEDISIDALSYINYKKQ